MSLELGRKYVKETEIRTLQLLTPDLFDLFDDGDPVSYAGQTYSVKKGYSPKIVVFTNRYDVSTTVEVGEYITDYGGVLEAMTEQMVDSYLVPMFDVENIFSDDTGVDLLAIFVEAFNSLYRKTDHFSMLYSGSGGVTLSNDRQSGLFYVESEIGGTVNKSDYEDLHDAISSFLWTVLAARS